MFPTAPPPPTLAVLQDFKSLFEQVALAQVSPQGALGLCQGAVPSLRQPRRDLPSAAPGLTLRGSHLYFIRKSTTLPRNTAWRGLRLLRRLACARPAPQPRPCPPTPFPAPPAPHRAHRVPAARAAAMRVVAWPRGGRGTGNRIRTPRRGRRGRGSGALRAPRRPSPPLRSGRRAGPAGRGAPSFQGGAGRKPFGAFHVVLSHVGLLPQSRETPVS